MAKKPLPARILVVEDESVVADDLEEILVDLGYEVVSTVASGEEAIAVSNRLKPDLILMDIRLRGKLDGIEAASLIQQHQSIPVVYLTSHTDEATLRRARATGPFGYLTKPFREKELHISIQVSLDRYAIEQQLSERQHWLNTLLNQVDDAVIAVDRNGYITLINPAAATLLNLPMEELIGQAWGDRLDFIDEITLASLWPDFVTLLTAAEPMRSSAVGLLISPAQVAIPVAITVASLQLAQQPISGLVITCHDLRDRRQAEANQQAQVRATQLETEIRALEQLNLLKDEFLNTVSHELRSPLSNIQMAIQMLMMTLDQGFHRSATAEPARIQHYLQILQTECERELNLVNDLLDLQRLESNAAATDLESIVLEAHLEAIAESYQLQAQRQQQHFTYSFRDCACLVWTEPNSLDRIVGELLHNACKYTPAQEYIELQAVYDAQRLHLQVHNSGVTLSEAELQRIFEKFYRISFAHAITQDGTGLGLPLVKQLVAHLQGTITATSTDRSIQFDVYLPLRAIHPTASPSSSEGPSTEYPEL